MTNLATAATVVGLIGKLLILYACAITAVIFFFFFLKLLANLVLSLGVAGFCSVSLSLFLSFLSALYSLPLEDECNLDDNLSTVPHGLFLLVISNHKPNTVSPTALPNMLTKAPILPLLPLLLK